MKLSALDAEYAALMDRLPFGLCGVDDWLLHDANQAMLRLIDVDAMSGAPSPSFRRWLGQGTLRMHSDGEKDGCGRALLHRADGRTFVLVWRPAGAAGEALRCLSVVEVPARRHALPAGGDSAKDLDSVLDNIHDGIWIIDGNGVTLRINKALERIAGIRAEEVVGRPVTAPLKEGRFKTCVTLQALKTRQTVTLFDDYSNGKRCLNTSTPIFDNEGRILRVIAVIRDLTELEELQRRLSRLEVEAMAYKLRAGGMDSDMEGGLMGQSLLLDNTRRDIVRAAHVGLVTLILGETGTGKTMAAKLIHDMSSRASKPFISLNCGSIAPTLMEAEIFGYEGGAFTGALRGGKPGMLELASGGTLLLDEIGELSLPMQAKLLHVLDGQPFYRVGGTQAISMNARLIAATNRPLDKMVARGEFREDLFYRLRILNVIMPPLRDRREDILLLAWHFLRKSTEAAGRELLLDPRTEQFFLSYPWPGNVRELKSVIQALTTLNRTGAILPSDLPPYMRENAGETQREASGIQRLPEALAGLEKKMLAEALAETGSTYKAARRLGISQSSVVRKAKKHGISTAATP